LTNVNLGELACGERLFIVVNKKPVLNHRESSGTEQKRRCQDLSIRNGKGIDQGLHLHLQPQQQISPLSSNESHHHPEAAAWNQGNIHTRTYLATHSAHFQCISTHAERKKLMQRPADRLPAFSKSPKKIRGHTIPADKVPEPENGCTVAPRAREEPSRVLIMANTFLS
jgi:hypothetical protein